MRPRRWGVWTLVACVLVSAAAAAQSRDSAGFRLEEATIDGVHAAFESGRLTCRELVQHYLNRIEAYDKKGPRLNTVQTVNPRAIERAAELDEAYQTSGPVGRLHCVPVLLKDQVETSDMPTTYGSVLFADFVPERDATIVVRLRAAGAIILAKTNLGEFANRYVGSAFGIIRNAYDPERNPSGSSGGTGSGVAANFGLVGIGEDTGGSIRGPAAVTNLAGLRPTVPLVSRHGMMPATPTTDTLGPMTRTVRDAALVLEVIAGYDENDPLTAYAVGRIPASYTEGLGEDGLGNARIGVVREPMDDQADPESEDYRKVRVVFAAAVDALVGLGAEVVDPVGVPDLRQLLERTGSGDFETEQAMNAYLEEHANAPVKTLQQILITGKVVPWRASGLIKAVEKSTHDPGYLEVLLARRELAERVLKVMADHRLDALAYPTFDHQPGLIGEDVLTNPAPDDSYGLGSNRALSPATGFPALTVPAGFTSDDLPVGLELLGRPFAEARLLELAYAFERGTRHRRPPPTTPPLPGEP